MRAPYKQIEIRSDVPLQEATTYKNVGSLKTVVYPKNINECKILIEYLEFYSLPYFIIGNGSNLLISPETKKICINLCKMREKTKIKDDILSFSSQIKLAKAFSVCKQHGFTGFENLATIPATLGGAIKNNASCNGQAVFDYLEKITLLKNGVLKSMKKSECNYSYHHTNLENCVIISASFKLPRAPSKEIEDNFQKAVEFRLSHQPKGFSCGSVFKNPENFSAGFLIDKCALKGKRRGGAVISDKHANFIINDNNASFEDINYLIEYCKEEVYRKFGIILEEEVEKIQ
ncbi:MAG: UDP-N-acetylmuramate dehydrogenase [Clostridia bacterium]|nr:UDP-N-acetylmuramate dehydrogenase [Clostridia bacterium]